MNLNRVLQPNLPTNCLIKITYRVTSRWRSVPAFINVTHQLGSSHRDVPFVTLVLDDGLEASSVRRLVQVDEVAVGNLGRHATLKIWKENNFYILTPFTASYTYSARSGCEIIT